jgi:hypothetical protein
MKLLISALILAVLAGPALALSTASNNAENGVTIRANVSNGVVLEPGDRVAFKYQAGRDGAIVFFDIDTQGYVSLLNDEPVRVEAHETRDLPGDGSELFAEGEPGVEFIFAVAVADLDAFDLEAVASLRDGSRRIDGDPFIAANMITAELIRNISQHTVAMGYAYFYVSERVDYPCYLCGTCEGAPITEGACDGLHIAQNFDRRVAMTYPLERGYDMVEVAANESGTTTNQNDVVIPDGEDDVNVNFYPYGSEVYYADPMAVNLWYDYGWYDPYWYGPYYPYCYSPWSFSIGFGWGWGWGGGGYYCSGWYDPWCGGGYYPGYYPDYPYGSVTKFKSQYKSGETTTLADNRTFAARRDGDLAVGSKGVRSSVKSPSSRSKVGFTNTRSASRVKTSVSGSRDIARGAWAKGRSGSPYNGKSAYRTRSNSMYRSKSGAPGRTVRERSGATRSRNNAVAPSRGGTTRSKGVMPSTRSGGGRSAPAYRGGSGWSGSRGGTAGGARGGGFKGGGGGRGGKGR